MSQLTAENLEGIGAERLLAATLAMTPDRIMLKVSVEKEGNERLLGEIRKSERNDAEIEARHKAEMERRGMEPVRHKADNGVQLVNNARDVLILTAVTTVLEGLGLVVSDLFWYEVPEKNPGRAFIRIVFEKKEKCAGRVVEVSDTGYNAMLWLLRRATYRYAQVWANLVVDPTTGEVFRSDSWNLNVPFRGREKHDLVLIERDENWVYELVAMR